MFVTEKSMESGKNKHKDTSQNFCHIGIPKAIYLQLFTFKREQLHLIYSQNLLQKLRSMLWK